MPGGGSAVPQAGLKGREFFPQGGSRSQDFKNLVPGAVFVIRVRKISTVMNDPNRRAFFFLRNGGKSFKLVLQRLELLC